MMVGKLTTLVPLEAFKLVYAWLWAWTWVLYGKGAKNSLS